MAIKITALSEAYLQEIQQVFNTEIVTLNFEFYASVGRWVFGFEYNGFQRNNIKVLPNNLLLRSYRNILPFDIICLTNDNLPPFHFEAFTNGNASGDEYGLFVVEKTEIPLIENVYGKIR